MSTSLLLAGLTLLPRVDAGAEVAHDLGLAAGLRGTIELRLDLTLFATADWSVDLFTAMRTYVRSNRDNESPIRISPQQVHYPVGLRWRFPLSEPGHAWGLVAFHQSNHDVDEPDPALIRETISYEIYAVEYVTPRWEILGGVWYDRGTRLDGSIQYWPFDYYLAGLSVAGDVPLDDLWYTAGRLTAVAHRNPDHAPAYLNLSGRVDAGARFEGVSGDWRVFLRFERVEDYRYLGDAPRHLLLLGTTLGASVR